MFYETGVNPKKNIEIMKLALAEVSIRKEKKGWGTSKVTHINLLVILYFCKLLKACFLVEGIEFFLMVGVQHPLFKNRHQCADYKNIVSNIY